MFNPKSGGKKPVIRKETVIVPVKKQLSNGTHRTPTTTAATPANRFKLSQKPHKSNGTTKSPTLRAPVQKAIVKVQGIKRKSNTPDRALFSSEDEDDEEDSSKDGLDGPQKRIKTNDALTQGTGPARQLVDETAFGEENALDIIHGADCTSGEYASKYRPPWDHDSFETLQLQYPSNSARERFELKWPRNEKEDYKPMEDISETIHKVVEFYFPDAAAEELVTDGVELERQFKRAWNHASIPEFKSIVEKFNALLSSLVQDGTIQRQLATRRRLPLLLVQRILDQIYARAVSPKVESLRAYENGTDYVYGELFYGFCSSIFHQVGLREDQVFVDLGSGVGNVVLQAALEVGCESWGIEYMKNPCRLAELQAKEFPARARLFGLKVGKVHLLQGDFTRNQEIGDVLKKADLVLVNNQAFTPALNDKLRDLFLDLKTGCKIVSLKPFVPEGHKISMRNIGSVANLFVQEKFDYFSNSVSWTNHGGNYYIATKDPRQLEKFYRDSGSH